MMAKSEHATNAHSISRLYADRAALRNADPGDPRVVLHSENRECPQRCDSRERVVAAQNDSRADRSLQRTAWRSAAGSGERLVVHDDAGHLRSQSGRAISEGDTDQSTQQQQHCVRWEFGGAGDDFMRLGLRFRGRNGKRRDLGDGSGWDVGVERTTLVWISFQSAAQQARLRLASRVTFVISFIKSEQFE